MVSYLGGFDYTAWVIIPLLIFIARLIDVSLATIRHILIYKGLRKIVPALAFVEVIVWLLAITQVMQNLTNWACFMAWAGGFSAGTYVGMLLEDKLALGHQLIRVITQGETNGLLAKLKESRYGFTTVHAVGARGAVDVLLVVSERKRLTELLKLLRSITPLPFYTIEDVRTVGMTPWGGGVAPGKLAMEGDLKKK